MAERSQAHLALGRAVRSLRAGEGLSQEDLAHLIGIHRTYLGGIERGERNPTYESLIRIAAALGISPAELHDRAERMRAGEGG